MDVNEFLPIYPEPQHEEINNIIFHKNEFYSLRLSEEDQMPARGDLFKYQEFIARFLSPETLNNGILLDWEMGVGKTCAALGTAEMHKKYFKGVLIFVKGGQLEESWIYDLHNRCTLNVYNPEDPNLNQKQRLQAVKKNIKKFYDFKTYNFFDNLEKLTKDQYQTILDKYEEYLVIIDEVHNLRNPDDRTQQNTPQKYLQAHRFLHDLKNCKIIIMSGTPMKNGPEEIASILNLILPLEKQLPAEDAFLTKFFDQKDNIYYMKSQKKDDLKSYMRGIVSFLRQMPSDVHQTYMGQPIGSLKLLNVVPNVMSEFQSQYYNNFFEQDKQGSKQSFHTQTRYASLFIFDDGTMDGKQDFKQLRGKTNAETLKNISKHSGTYAAIIKSILENPKKLTFVYINLVTKSGLQTFAALLNLFDFTQTKKGYETKKAKRYGILSSETKEFIPTIIQNCNRPENMEGDYIQVLIGSKIVSEGFNLLNMQECHVATPYWNYSETAQAIARILRVNSFNDLIKGGIVPNVRIYRHVSIPYDLQNYKNSFDYILYHTSEVKDMSIKNVERLIREAAVDCALFYKRNKFNSSFDYTRDCDYQPCEYVCDGVDIQEITDGITPEYSTFDIFYIDKIIDNIIQHILSYFREEFCIHAHGLLKLLREDSIVHTDFEFFAAVNKIIAENIPVPNNYNLNCYMREKNDLLYLVDSISVVDDFSACFYAEYPVLNMGKTFEHILTVFTPNILIEKMIQTDNYEDFNDFYNSLPDQVQDDFITSLPNALQTQTTDSKILRFRNWLERVIEQQQEQQEEEQVVEQVDESLPLYELQNEEQLIGASEYFGLIVPSKKGLLFKIRQKQNKLELKTKKQPKGRECITWTTDSIIDVVLANQISYNSASISNLSEDEFNVLINKPENKDVLKMISEKKDKIKTLDDKKRVLFFMKVKNAREKCKIIEDWLKENRLLFRASD